MMTQTSTTDPRDVRALTEYLTVLPAGDRFEVVSQSGSAYTVDPDARTCDCPDFEYRQPAGGCKHVRRVLMELGKRPVPAAVETDAVPDDFGRHVEPVLVADGGSVPGDECAECAALPGGVCAECFIHDGKDWPAAE